MNQLANEILIEFSLDGHGIITWIEEKESNGESWLNFMVHGRNEKGMRFPIDKPNLFAPLIAHMEKHGLWLLQARAIYFDGNGNEIKEITISDGFRYNRQETLQQVLAGTYKSEWIPLEEREEKIVTFGTTRPGRILENGQLSEWRDISWMAHGIDMGEGHYIPKEEHEANGYYKVLELGEYGKTIKIYSCNKADQEYLIEICYGENTYEEFIYCKTMRDFLDFMKELKPVIDGIQHHDVMTHLGGIKEEIREEIQDIRQAENEEQFLLLLQNLEYYQDDIDSVMKIVKRKSFIVSDIQKEVIKATKNRQ
jgi:hypothetical protein